MVQCCFPRKKKDYINHAVKVSVNGTQGTNQSVKMSVNSTQERVILKINQLKLVLTVQRVQRYFPEKVYEKVKIIVR